MKGTLEILDRSGHTEYKYDTEATKAGRLDQEFADREFKKMVAKGYMAVGTTPQGDKELIRTFEPGRFSRITVSPRLVGG